MRFLPQFPTPNPRSGFTASGRALHRRPKQGRPGVANWSKVAFRPLDRVRASCERDKMQRAACAGGGRFTEGTRGPLRSRPGGQRFQALSAHGAAHLIQPGPHLSCRPPRTPSGAGGSRLGRGACARPPRTFAPPPLAAGRGRGRGRVRAGPGGRRRPFPPPRTHTPQRSGAELPEHLPTSPKLTRPQSWETEGSQPGARQ